MKQNIFVPIPQALEHVRQGEMIIVVDGEQRENEGDLVVAAEHMTTEKMAFFIRHTGGVVCLSLSNEIADKLELPPMVERNTSARGTPFTESIEAASNVTTGISAKDRATTVAAAINPVAIPEDLSRPGHVFPLRAQDGGVLVRAGHTEASVDLCKLAGVQKGAVISELMHEDGTMMRVPDLQKFSEEHDIPLVSIADLIAYRRKNETFIRKEAETILETQTGEWTMRVYKETIQNSEHVALIKGDVKPMTPTLVRVHSECLTGDAFGSVHCDCGDQLDAAMQQIEKQGAGVVVYMRQEGRGIGLTNKVRAYNLQEQGLDTVEANEKLGFPMDLRTYGIGAQILKDCGVGHILLMTNNPKKVVGLEGYGLHLIEQVPLHTEIKSEKQKKYLQTKKEKMGHIM
ncbi:MAG: bifunctional 3,4-dihydroxy-2-butanone-4-phosphate synthase/GTP cyclohydrolase II [Candidatus Peribacter sp.]|jgi:3,4-dihydroxy 2-butanone 4-phosphate synthase / GTP cyclohydrolase II|nr:bifunctional 3,4-dihydroxy-2-butanone-4-phosphate synthase/GTP cyclohydrolase II [Candidatus Peribacter sp.]MBT4392954.1 bifunctional 3,4-dihydroxy-2-butanone-4-phosphate synthase/GTP cyclohydrolase II [Candidatus Peribacter sp.]MBT4601014.1 bifunctional 3,4-dihydroxy-2-butanone-4-phosphate synthase/GTP cyclohydrolase II [Candidatus Peribacter sp.]MBT5149056.1 bifunctional 3,4-dihydroxy-2-butanone-4-phosphate synthase/GTP cyclohydrolase II [Candidatus Peribacter sp.]MBT5637380.1 bifunctional